MALVYRTVVAGQAWLTAVMTLVAGMPQFSCICPDGTVKAFCVSFSTDPMACCCGGGKCCSPSKAGGACCCKATSTPHVAGPTGKTCCGEHRDKKPDEQQGVRLQADQKGCTRTLAQPAVTVVSYYKTAVDKDTSFDALLPQSLAPSPCWLVTAHGPTFWQINLVAPPTDLVDLLQHYLI